MLLACFVVAGQDGGGSQRQTPGAGIPANQTFRPVTDAMLEKPEDGEWINWRRTYNGTGYSPLNQINKSNVAQLQMVWAWGLAPGASQPTPLVHDGIMFIPSPGGGVQAVDAVSGEPLWEYRAPKPHEGNGEVRNTPTRNIAIYGSNIYVATGDARLIALDARTGRTVWDTQVFDAKLGYTYTSGPLAVKGVLINGVTDVSDIKMTSATSRDTTRAQARNCGGRRPSHVPAKRAARPGKASRCSSARAAMRGLPAATMLERASCIGVLPRPNRGRNSSAEPWATHCTPTARWRSIRSPAK